MKGKEALYAVIGGVVGAVLTMAAGSFSTLGAKDEAADLNLGNITCKSLKVVDSNGVAGVTISSAGSGSIIVWNEGGSSVGVAIGGGSEEYRYGASVDVYGGNDNITIGRNIGILVEGRGKAAYDERIGRNHLGMVAIHGILGGIFVNQPLPDRASSVYIGGHHGGGILVKDGKGIKTPGSFGSVAITATDGGRLEFGDDSDSSGGHYAIVETNEHGRLKVGTQDEHGQFWWGILGK